jgi:hypothetical protein
MQMQPLSLLRFTTIIAGVAAIALGAEAKRPHEAKNEQERASED